MLQYISNASHYTDVLSHCKDVKHALWIGTADIKDAYIEIKGEKMPFLKLMAQLIRKGVEIRLIHAKEPGTAFREDFDKYQEILEKVSDIVAELFSGDG